MVKQIFKNIIYNVVITAGILVLLPKAIPVAQKLVDKIEDVTRGLVKRQ